MHVLLVEDDELVRLCLREVLAAAGLHVLEALDAEDALGLMQSAVPPDVVVSDVNLGPGLDGFGFAAVLRQRWPTIRVLLISGIAANAIGHRLGPFDRFLPKPFTCAALLHILDELTGPRPDAPAEAAG